MNLVAPLTVSGPGRHSVRIQLPTALEPGWLSATSPLVGWSQSTRTDAATGRKRRCNTAVAGCFS